MGKSFALEAGLHPGQGQGPKGEDAAVLVEVVAGGPHHKLTSRGTDASEEAKRAAPNGASGSNGPTGDRNPPTDQ